LKIQSTFKSENFTSSIAEHKEQSVIP